MNPNRLSCGNISTQCAASTHSKSRCACGTSTDGQSDDIQRRCAIDDPPVEFESGRCHQECPINVEGPAVLLEGLIECADSELLAGGDVEIAVVGVNADVL